jgi:hypothetical protein
MKQIKLLLLAACLVSFAGTTMLTAGAAVGPLLVFIRDESGKPYNFELFPGDTVKSLKEKLSAQNGVVVTRIDLIHSGKLLSNDAATIGSLNIAGETLFARIKPVRPAAPAPAPAAVARPAMPSAPAAPTVADRLAAALTENARLTKRVAELEAEVAGLKAEVTGLKEVITALGGR